MRGERTSGEDEREETGHGRTTQRRVLMSDQNPSSCSLRMVGDWGGVPLGVSNGLAICSVAQSFARAEICRTFEFGRVR